MAIEVVLPKVDMDMESGVIAAWKVAEGDRVRAGDILFEMETSKSIMEVESPGSGIIRGLRPSTGPPSPWARRWRGSSDGRRSRRAERRRADADPSREATARRHAHARTPRAASRRQAGSRAAADPCDRVGDAARYARRTARADDRRRSWQRERIRTRGRISRERRTCRRAATAPRSRVGRA